MDSTLPTLGIYGIQDRIDSESPQMVHDHNLAFIENGEVKKFLQLERISRIKRDNKLHHRLVALMTEEKLVDTEMDVVFVDNRVGRSFISSNGQIRFEAPLNKRLTKDWEEGQLWWFNRELKSFILNHELAHIFSCLPFFGNFKENSLMIHFDGGASLSNFSAWMYRMGKIIPVEHHWEMKQLTSLYNANALTFGIMGAKKEDQNSVPEKMMEFAALGTYNENIESFANTIRTDDGGTHVIGFRTALSKSLRDYAIKNGLVKSEKDAFTSDDLKEGLTAVVFIKMPSNETRKILVTCKATIGIISNPDHFLEVSGKAGRSRWLGRRPRNRGVAMNPVDHPMGGGEGKASGGHPRSRKGIPAKGYKTRKPKNVSNKLIIERRK